MRQTLSLDCRGASRIPLAWDSARRNRKLDAGVCWRHNTCIEPQNRLACIIHEGSAESLIDVGLHRVA
jgi:hypothetical protein